MPIVVGGGISGIACARAMLDAGAEPLVLDRGRALGGRMATRTLRDTSTPWDGHVVDIGASYFTVSDESFRMVVDDWIARDLVRPWTDTFHVADPSGIHGVRTGPMRYAAQRGLRSLVVDLARTLPTITSHIDVDSIEPRDGGLQVNDLWTDAVALCMPVPQAQRLWAVPAEHVWEPVIAVTLVFEERQWMDIDGVFVNDDSIITWIADDGRRRGDGAAVLVAHTNPVFAAMHLDDPTAVLPATIDAVARVMRIDQHPTWVDVHRWTYAKPMAAHVDPFWSDPLVPLGIAGDAWAAGPKVESAWLSGTALGSALLR
jgi:renalase